MPELEVKTLPSTDAGRLIVRLNISFRNGIPRYGIAKIINSSNERSILALVLGHDDKNAIFMPYDIRTELDAQKGDKISFTIKQVCFPGKLRWYMQSPDPAIHIPAWLALISLTLGTIGIILASCTLI